MHSAFTRISQALTASAALAAAAFVISAACPARAWAGSDPAFYIYTLQDAVFGLGSGTASGYFVYNPRTYEIGDFDIDTSAGSTESVATAGELYSNMDGNCDVSQRDIESANEDFHFFHGPFAAGLPIANVVLETESVTDGGPYRSLAFGEYAPISGGFDERAGRCTIEGEPVAAATKLVSFTVTPGVADWGKTAIYATVTLDNPAPEGGAAVKLSSIYAPAAVDIPSSVTVPGGRTVTTFVIPTQSGFGGGAPFATAEYNGSSITVDD